MNELMEKIQALMVETFRGQEQVSAFCVVAKKIAPRMSNGQCVIYGDSNLMLNSIITEVARILAAMSKDEDALNRALAGFSGGLHRAATMMYRREQIYRREHEIFVTPEMLMDFENDLRDRILKSKWGEEHGPEHKD